MGESIITNIISIIRERQSADNAPVKIRDIADAAGLSIYQVRSYLEQLRAVGVLEKSKCRKGSARIMASALTVFPEDGDINRIWYDRFCIEFNSDGGLSPAELRVIRLLLQGYNCGQIAALCFRSVKTISAQKVLAFRRLGVRNDATLLPTLMLLGMVTLYTDLNRCHSLEEGGPECGSEAG